ASVDFAGRRLSGVPLAVLNPYCDGDVSDQQGLALYDRSRYATAGDPAPKSTFLLYGANHNAFNSTWSRGPGSFDDAEWLGSSGGICEPEGPGRLGADHQARAGAVLMAGYLRRYLREDLGFERLVTGTAPIPA